MQGILCMIIYMKTICIVTEKFSIYYELSRGLKEMNISFTALPLGAKIPNNMGVVITTKEEESKIRFPKKVIFSSIQETIIKAIQIASGKESYSQLIIGIDPGQKPGVVVIGDCRVINASNADSPEGVAKFVKQNIKSYACEDVRIKIGCGDPTQRNRIVNALFGLGIPIEIVDEASTTRKHVRNPDIDAALNIAKMQGYAVKRRYEINPTRGEIKEIQRRSRLVDGTVTISTTLANKVAKGELNLDAAVKKQKRKNRKSGKS